MTVETAETPSGRLRSLGRWLNRSWLARKLAIAVAVAAAVAGVATYAALTESPPFGSDPDTVLVLLYVDLVLLLLLAALIARRMVQVWADRRRGSAGSLLHVRLVVLFSFLAVTPAIVVAVFSALFFNFGLQAWFSERVSTAVRDSVAVANAYLDEHVRNIRADVLSLAKNLSRTLPLLVAPTPEKLALINEFVNEQADRFSLPEVIVFDGNQLVIAQSRLSFAMERDVLPFSAFEKAQRGEVALLRTESDDRVRALVRVDNENDIYPDTYLFVGRFVEPGVLRHVEKAQGALREYESLEGRSSDIQITFVMIFVVVAMLLLLVAVWVGLNFATRLAEPISNLIGAAERVRAGDLSVRVPEGAKDDEVATLTRAFNRMTGQLAEQRRELVEANRQLDLRRRFTEVVLAGVSAGVIGLEREGRINLPNRSAAELLSTDLDGMVGRPLAEVVPEMASLISEARERPGRLAEGQINVLRKGRARTLLVRIAAEREEDDVLGYVVTFDDVTELLAAQRKAAWADVARRIAHEIKNPLTPIQLSAERLKRKYLKEIKTDPEVFRTCTETIVRQVGDIGRMVDEFSAFARMPAPVMRREELTDLCRQAVFLQRNANQGIVYDTEFPDGEVWLACDGRQIGQAVTNLLQNAADSINGRQAGNGASESVGHILLRVGRSERGPVIEVEDNGKGFPEELLNRLTEPYVTTREKGTGLGLAIVKKIMEDHGAELVLEGRDEGGARVRMIFRAQEEQVKAETPEAPEGLPEPA